MKKPGLLVILVGHGQFPLDMPHTLQTEYLTLLHKRDRTPQEEQRLTELTKTVLSWPRNEGNDPYWSSVRKLALLLEQALKDSKVMVAFNEFCPPLLEEALENACKSNHRKIMVLTTKLIPGGVHSEIEIPRLIEDFSRRYGKKIVYVWPIDMQNLVELYVKEIEVRLKQLALETMFNNSPRLKPL
ncbi:MAG: CbiX/SirB N-terminal domain-containing protein [Candidatus Caldarchaeum sp.]